MKHISDLADSGFAKRCLLVGGGHSINDFNFNDVEDTVVICANSHKKEIADIIFYFDKNVNDYYIEHGDELSRHTILVGYINKGIKNVCERCDYCYNYSDIVFGDTGFHMLQFADKLFNFSEIYLIGYDYTATHKSYHWNEEESHPKKMADFLKHSENVLPKYREIQWNNQIFNLSKDSRLDMFENAQFIP